MRNVEIYVGGDKFLTDKVHDDAIYETNIKLTLKVDQNIFKNILPKTEALSKLDSISLR